MPAKNPERYLFDMPEAARKIQRFIAGYSEARFMQDERTITAVEVVEPTGAETMVVVRIAGSQVIARFEPNAVLSVANR
jgi:hypothetical protein